MSPAFSRFALQFSPVRRFYAVLATGYLLLTLVFGAALWTEFRQIDLNLATLARERGSVLFRLIELTREWNARHGGVYVPVTAQTQPNPYLKHPRRDLTTRDGQALTMVNPAFMTRQIAEIAEQAEGLRFHITSLRPIRPANQPDPWESEALGEFERNGIQEKLAFFNGDGGPVYRYMAPLLVHQPCLKCHESQGYKLGDIRGGISVTMPASAQLAVRDQQRQRATLTHMASFTAIALLLHLVAWRTRRHFLHLEELAGDQERLITSRTQELSLANARLLAEVAERQRKEQQIADSESRYRSVVETSQDGILIMAAPDFRVVFANERLAAIIRQETTALVGLTVLDFIHPDDRPLVADRLARRERGEVVQSGLRLRVESPLGGEPRVVDAYVAEIVSTPDQVRQWVVSVRDVTDKLATERELQIAATVMANAAEGIIVTDQENRVIQVNPAFTRITGFTAAEILGRDPKVLRSGRHDPEFFSAMRESLQQTGRWEGEIWNRRRDGSVYPQWLSITALGDAAAGNGVRHVATFIDITQRKEAEELLRHRANTDPLTELSNRALFYDRLQMALTLSRRYGHQFALIYVDLDHFKAVNDSLGHAAGDELLVEAARRLSLVVRESDTVARLGGDEFAVILPEIRQQAEVVEVAQRIVHTLARPFHLGNEEVRVSGSVGVALYPEHGEDLERLKRHADLALYQVKAAGRNGYRIYTAGDGQSLAG